MNQLISPTLHTAAMAALEGAANQALQMATEAKAELTELDGCVFALECTSPELEVFIQPLQGELRLMGVYDGVVTTRVRGSASDFTALATATDPASSLINGELELEGESAPLIELQHIIGRLDLDWEAPLVNTLGDVAGHQLAQLLRSGFNWGHQAGTNLGRQLDEFIHEEARLSPPKLELEDFYGDVQDLALRVDRLESRMARLKKRLQVEGN
ncbi:MAG: SCP2 sterol-binding domain-containing protein [Halioglobus sp.]